MKVDIKDLKIRTESIIQTKIIETIIPPQGMDSQVFIAKDEKSIEYVIKYGEGTINDLLALNFINKNKINVAIPKVYGSFVLENKTGLILEKINFPLLDSIPKDQIAKYIPSMLQNLKEIHNIKSPLASPIAKPLRNETWKEIILAMFNGTNPHLNWQQISLRKSLDTKLILKSVENIVNKMTEIDFIEQDYSLLHIDFNQRNLFVNPTNYQIAAIIDWGEAMFGDPIYDFARVRMLIWHFDLGLDAIVNYYNMMSYSEEQKKLDEIYWLSRVIEYLAYYSEDLTEFNLNRIKLHQEFLKDFDWAKL